MLAGVLKIFSFEDFFYDGLGSQLFSSLHAFGECIDVMLRVFNSVRFPK